MCRDLIFKVSRFIPAVLILLFPADGFASLDHDQKVKDRKCLVEKKQKKTFLPEELPPSNPLEQPYLPVDAD